MATATAQSELHKFIKALDTLREEDDTMPIQTARLLLAVAFRPGMTFADLEGEVGLSHASVSRNVAYLSKWHKLGKPGLELLEAVEDPHERRRKVVFLTAKGRKRLQKTIEALYGQSVEWMTLTPQDFLSKAHGARSRT